ncbi:F-box protein [Dorcoceras hygrometricum]|uniref:F-box protein n=1 Tax=Dorcoceras hygrometricum TaxID=472368 RepID=A0A2Z7DCY0_9LAMI|nr:F-box protein [Dorcoceras hygrometricum]
MKSKRQRMDANSGKSRRRRRANSAEDIEKPYLPYELIFEILCYLPVISLLRFKTVCKLWRDTIEDPRFVEKHMEPQASLVISYHADTGDTPDRDNSTAGLESSSIMCFLHGLQLEKCNSTHTYRIKNPSTKQVLTLPCPKNSVLTMSMCYISTRHEYKLVYLYHEELTHDRLGCEVLTIGTDSSWRSIDIPAGISYDPIIDKLKDCILINGVFYAVKESEYGDFKLICIAIEKEEFLQVDFPINLLSDRATMWPLRWNCSVLSFVTVVRQRLHVWILEDFSKKRWSKNRIDIPLTFWRDFPDLGEDIYIRGITDDVLLFIVKSEHAIFYSIKSASVMYKASAPPGKKLFLFSNRSTLISLSGMQPAAA